MTSVVTLVATCALAAGCPSPHSAMDSKRRAPPPPAKARPQPGPGSTVKARPVKAPPAHHQAMFRGGPLRQGRTKQIIPRVTPRILWVHATGRPVFSSPAVDRDGNIYVGSLDHHLYSLGPDGNLRWRRRLDGTVYSSAALLAGGVLVGTDADRLHLLEVTKGSGRWSVTLGACARNPGFGPDRVRCHGDASPAVGPRGDIYMGGDALYAFNAGGKLRWRFELGGHAFSSPVVGPDGTVYIGTQADTVHAVTPRGTGKWKFSTRGDCDATGALTDNGALVIGCDDRQVYALDRATGKLRWKYAARGAVRSSPAVSVQGTVLVGSDDHRLHALDQTTGALLWSFKTEGRVRSSPTVDPRGTVVFGSQDDHVHALDALGKQLWKLRLGGDVDSSVALATGGLMIVGADDGRIYALQQHNKATDKNTTNNNTTDNKPKNKRKK